MFLLEGKGGGGGMDMSLLFHQQRFGLGSVPGLSKQYTFFNMPYYIFIKNKNSHCTRQAVY